MLNYISFFYLQFIFLKYFSIWMIIQHIIVCKFFTT